MMLDITFGGALLFGLASFFTPCVLPMVPFYLAYMGGMSMGELREDGQIAPGAQRRLFVSAIFFALGVTTLFVALGMGATALGQTVRMYKETLSYFAAGLIAIFGLHFLGVIRIGLLYREAKMQSKADPTTVIGAYLMGVAFGFGWSACVGPILASVLMIASGMGEIWRGGVLLLCYGLGMTIPFVIVALFAKPFLAWMQRNRKYMGYVEKVLGVMLIVFAVLIATNTLNQIADAMIRWVPWFQEIG
jgi:cytochrome c-type biogenesis protein